MASDFPASLDAFPDPLVNSPLNSPSHAALHQDVNDAVEKIEVKLGVGASDADDASVNQVLMADGSGGSAWESVTNSKIDTTGEASGSVLVADGAGGASWASDSIGLWKVASGSFSGITAASPLVISNVLTTDYPHYKIVMSWTQATAGGFLTMRLRNSGGLISTATYDNQRSEMYTSTIIAAGALNGTAWNALAYNYNLGFQSFFNGDITFATVAQPTQLNGTGTTKRTGAGGSFIYTQSSVSMENTATVATGLNIWTDGGAMTGSYKIYGYRN
jgi:hypothetical protein